MGQVLKTGVALMVLAVWAAGGIDPTFGQASSNKPVRLVVGFAAGGAADTTARIVAPKLSAVLGQSVVVDNRAGANGILAAEGVANAPPDGTTLLVPTNGMFTINPVLYKKLRYSPLDDYSVISRVVVIPNVLTVHPSLPVKSVWELIKLAKTRPGDLAYGSGGVGGIPHLSGALFASMTHTKLLHVPYKSGGQSTIGVLSGEVALTFNTLVTSIPHIRAGKLKGLGVTTVARAPQLPDLPTIAEAGVPGYESSTWYGLAGPAHMPKEAVDKISAALAKVLQMSEVQKAFHGLGADPTFDKPEQFAKVIRTDLDKWAKVVKDAGITQQ
jgi:tripartite-type tricarboxylate transporter receptor subunit TctC